MKNHPEDEKTANYIILSSTIYIFHSESVDKSFKTQPRVVEYR